MTVIASFSPVIAQEDQNCFPNLVHYDICADARKMQAAMAQSLPMQLSKNITMQTVVAEGPLLLVTAIWNFQKDQVDAALAASNMTMADLAARIEQTTHNSVCSTPQSAAFIRLGGQMEYLYKTTDGYVVLSPTVRNCPARAP